MNKNIIISVVLALVVFAGIGGYVVYAQNQLAKANEATAAVQAELMNLQAQKATVDTELTASKDAEVKELENLATFSMIQAALSGMKTTETSSTASKITTTLSASGTTTASGTLIEEDSELIAEETLPEATSMEEPSEVTLDMFYSPSVVVEGPVAAINFAKYKLELTKALKIQDAQDAVVGYPIEMSQGEWTAVVELKDVYTQIAQKLELSASGSLVPAVKPATKRKSQEMVMVLAKWENGVIVEQYSFDYTADAAKSKLLDYMNQ